MNLRTQFERIVDRTGVDRWEKPLQNMRASRETELVEEGYPEHEVARWLGNTVSVARQHYLMARQETMARAAGFSPPDSQGADVAQILAQQATESTSSEPQPVRQTREKLVSPENGEPASTPTGSRATSGLWPRDAKSAGTRHRIRHTDG